MQNIETYEYDCTQKCQLREHGNIITSALTKMSISDEKLAAFIAKTCCNFCNVVDDLGRSAVHMAASVGRVVILEWLLNQGAKLNESDLESGVTPIHRAILYGQVDCAILLMRYGARLDIRDYDARTPLDYCLREGQDRADSELFVWGSNKNFNLGVGAEEEIKSPYVMDCFRKTNINIIEVAMGNYHSLFLDENGHLYAVGLGLGGRLGNDGENSHQVPTKVKVPHKGSEKIVALSVSNKHSLVLTSLSIVYGCGINDNQQLGFAKDIDKVLVFKKILRMPEITNIIVRNVIARDNHSIAYTDKQLYVWGLNSGQFNLPSELPIVGTPTKIKLYNSPNIVLSIVGNDVATVVQFINNKLFVFYKGTIKYPKRLQGKLYSISVTGGDNKTVKGSATALKIIIGLRDSMVIWYEMTGLYYRCVFESHIRIKEIEEVICKGNQLLLIADGNAYIGKCNQKRVVHIQKKYVNRYGIDCWTNCCEPLFSNYCKDYDVRVELKRILELDRVRNIYSNEDFSSFAVLQAAEKFDFSYDEKRKYYNFQKLYNESTEDDNIHDVTIIVNSQIYPAHKVILKARAPLLYKIIEKETNKEPKKIVHLKYENLTNHLFDVMYKYIYCNVVPNKEDLETSFNDVETRTVFYHLLLAFATQFGIKYLKVYAQNLIDDGPWLKVPLFKCFERDFGATLQDVSIKCDDNSIIRAHKCVLAERLDYFNVMFSHNWIERTMEFVDMSAVPKVCLIPLIDFVYTMDEKKFRRGDYSKSFLYDMIILCDQLLFMDLRIICEKMLTDLISLRKLDEMLEFSIIYNCDEILQNYCLEMICVNLARILYFGNLKDCDMRMLEHVNKFYQNLFSDSYSVPMITPYSSAIEDAFLLSFVEDFEVDLKAKKTVIEPVIMEKPKIITASKSRLYEIQAIAQMQEELKKKLENDIKPICKNDEIYEEALTKAKDVCLSADTWQRVKAKKEKTQRSQQQQEQLSVHNKKEEEGAVADEDENATTEEERLANIATTSQYKCTVNLAHIVGLTPPSEKLSQKQRKRLSSTSSNSPISTKSKNLTPLDIPNAWEPLTPTNTPTPTTEIPTTDSSPDFSSFANILRVNENKATSTGAIKKYKPVNTFQEIIEHERTIQEQHDRLINKNLKLIQLEDAAILQLREFYNANNVDDEDITVERVTPQQEQQPTTITYSNWHHNKRNNN